MESKKYHESKIVMKIDCDIGNSMTMKFAEMFKEENRAEKRSSKPYEAEYEYINQIQEKLTAALAPLNIGDTPIYIVALEALMRSFESALENFEGDPMLAAAFRAHLKSLREATDLNIITCAQE